MVAEFRRRFWLTLLLTGPILALSPMIQMMLGVEEALRFEGSDYALFVLRPSCSSTEGGPS
jgi:P-type Cu2+ transporter